MRRLIGFVVASLLVTVAGLAGEGRGTVLSPAPSTPSTPAYKPLPLPSSHVGDAPLEYDRRYSNHIREFGFTVPSEMNPVDRGQTTEELAREFLTLNALALGIRQNISAFKHLEDVSFSDGSRLVRFEQSYGFVPIRTSFIELELVGQVIVRASLRIIPDISQLPLCQPHIGSGYRLYQSYYLPETSQTIIVVSVEDDVTQGEVKTVYNACTNEIIGFETHLQ